jgi:hypothetical protein
MTTRTSSLTLPPRSTTRTPRVTSSLSSGSNVRTMPPFTANSPSMTVRLAGGVPSTMRIW